MCREELYRDSRLAAMPDQIDDSGVDIGSVVASPSGIARRVATEEDLEDIRLVMRGRICPRPEEIAPKRSDPCKSVDERS